jgi:uncharacterized membrane-anchored protein
MTLTRTVQILEEVVGMNPTEAYAALRQESLWTPHPGGKLVNRIADVTILFWIIKILSTTVGETVADYLSQDLELGLVITSYIMTGAFLIAFYFQLRAKAYVPAIYWTVVVLISIVGTLISDNLVDNLGVSLVTTTVVFSIGLILVFVLWYRSERTLSVHTIYTLRRELFYWAAILLTFSLGTSGGDLVSERLDVGYAQSTLLFAALIGAIAGGYFFLGVNAVLAFWLGYILTRPLGASMGDLLAKIPDLGGLGWGTTMTSAVFLTTIAGLVAYLGRRNRIMQLESA